MKAADTSASRAIADWTPLTVASRSRTTAEMETFISDVSTTRTNMAIASRIARRRLKTGASGSVPASVDSVMSPPRGPGEYAGRAGHARTVAVLVGTVLIVGALLGPGGAPAAGPEVPAATTPVG